MSRGLSVDVGTFLEHFNKEGQGHVIHVCPQLNFVTREELFWTLVRRSWHQRLLKLSTTHFLIITKINTATVRNCKVHEYVYLRLWHHRHGTSTYTEVM